MGVWERGGCWGGSAVGKQLLGTGLQLICCVQLLGASEKVWGDMYSMYSVTPFREAMLSGAGHCRAYTVLFLQEVCYAQRGCEASCVCPLGPWSWEYVLQELEMMRKALDGLSSFLGSSRLSCFRKQEIWYISGSGQFSWSILYISGQGDQCRGEYFLLRLAWEFLCRIYRIFRICSVHVFYTNNTVKTLRFTPVALHGDLWTCEQNRDFFGTAQGPFGDL